ncbi:DUF4124 domain-containing protein [Dechloromonas sp. HYN0024]|uniref:DUF4124 domain-containing protein n=1 Tax=Dechloromonas sp. HYN0024 TaxID=2231055 RepID=UPI000E43C64F|nr:DUF4124 domain-containing protein [Dechloromonas sp. HYN0024]AXS80336.1 DUF4124 domain-containing protein [Dechloromonas sp. HYN0024]
MLKIFIASATLIFLSTAASAEIYKCRLANGNTEISNLPCPLGSSTITSRPDERVSEAARRQAEHEVERMRQYVEKREASQRAEDTAARDERAATQPRRTPPPAPTLQRQYANTEECLRSIEGMALEATQRAQMEAECHNIAAPPQNVYIPGTVPAYPQHPHSHQPPSHLPNQLPTQQPMPKTDPLPTAPKIVMPPLQK